MKKEIKTIADNLIVIINKLNSLTLEINNLKNNVYQKIKEVDVNSTEYEFTEYNENNWYQFYVEIKIGNSEEIFIGNLERCAGLPKNITNSMVLKTSGQGFLNIYFNGENKKLWIDEGTEIISKIFIFQKKEII